ISPDCDNNGIPDGTNGAVWAGNIVDAETIQKFSATTNAANGDDNDNRQDEDGLTPPAIPLNLGYSYTFNVRLNSNQTGKTVYYGLWFDWNSDGNFNNDNATGTGPAFYSGSGVATSPVDIPVLVKAPATAGSGAGQANLASYKTRLIASDVPVTSSMFGGTFANGEIEDYQAAAVILPVTFGNMSAQAKECNVYVSFDILTQLNASHFEIEYSNDRGAKWSQLAAIPASGSSNISHSYSYIHTRPVPGINLYRIKNVDRDGKFMYSETLSANNTCSGKGGIISYPNPVHATLTVLLPINTGKVQLRITDAAGKLVQNITTQNSLNTINTHLLAGGMYILEVLNANRVVYSSKFIKE
ncbi:MAG: T9SS type A sorting domain-containing protein, partial [Chitinophagaceae bacterium]|nr:T9SS type A sorting domain-containing protein [Chitinophagaceae bacterium]